MDVLGSCSEFDLEIVYVDDGSSDQSPVLLGNIAEADIDASALFSFREISVTRQQSPPGLRQTAGDIVAIIDADLQDPIELILEMIANWREGYSVCSRRQSP